MNKLEVADLIEQIPQELTPDEFLVALATKAAEWEREQCAKICDDWPVGRDDICFVAGVIRARSKK